MADLTKLLDEEGILFPSIGPQVPPLILGIGTPGDDQMVGTQLADRIEGLAGNDTVLAGGGDDRAFGGAGTDIINGGNGDDRLEGGAGDDRVAGARGSDIVNGGPGADVVLGGRSIDRLGGQGGDDRMAGGEGHDLLFGGRGSDLLDGGPGADSLTGGAGRDTLAFSGIDEGVDTITDFGSGVDRLDLGLLLPGFVAGDPLADFVRFTVDGEDTLIAVNQDGDGSDFVEIARLEGVQIDELPPADLGLPDGPTPADIDGPGDVAEARFPPGIAADGRSVTRTDDLDVVGEQSAGAPVHAAPVESGAQPVPSADVLSSEWSSGAEGGAAAAPVFVGALDLGLLVDIPSAGEG